MPMSNYPRGFAHGITIRGLPLQVAHPGKVFWVNNSGVLPEGGIGASDGNDGTYLRPFSTLDYAIGRCTASRGDIIMVMPGHVEAVTATSIAMDVAGVAVVGLGEGDARPKFNFGVTTSNIIVSAANCSMKNLVMVATVDSVVAGITLTAAGDGLTLDLETRDTSSAIEFISALVTVSGANNLVATLRHRGFAAGDAMVRYVDLVGCTDAQLDLDFFGIASTAVVNMRTTACNNIMVRGRFYNDSVALTKNVTNSTTSTWSVDGYDAKGGYYFAGSDDTAVASLLTGSSTAMGTDGTTVTDSATTVLGAIGADNANNAFGSTSVTANADGSVLERQEYIQTDMLGLPRSIASAAKTLTTGNVGMFTISGGPIKVLEIVGIVTTVVQSQTTSVKVTVTTTSPAATSDFSAAAVDITGAAAGSSIRHINTTGILTVVAAGFVNEGNAFATNDTQYLVPAGTLQVNNASSSNTGAITWYLRYIPLSPLSRVA